MKTDDRNTVQTSPGIKYDAGKYRFDLIPAKMMMSLAKLVTLGADKYGVRNWEKGMEFGKLYAAMERHSWKWWGGEEFDPEDGQHHLDSVIWCAMALRELRETHPECDDRLESNKRHKNSIVDYDDKRDHVCQTSDTLLKSKKSTTGVKSFLGTLIRRFTG